MLTKASIFLRSDVFPFLETMNPKIVLEHTIDAHLSGFKPISYSLHFKGVDKSLKIVKSFLKIFMNTSMYSWKVLMIAF